MSLSSYSNSNSKSIGNVNNKDMIITGTKDLSHEFLRPIPDIVRLTYLIGSFIADSRKRECDISIKNEDIFENLIAAISMIWYMSGIYMSCECN